MSSSDRAVRRPRRIAALAGVLLALTAIAGCTVRPLYSDATAAIGTGGAENARLASVEVKPAGDRVGQEVRNHLIFLLGGGRGQPADPAYSLTLSTRAVSARAATIETGGRVALAPTSGVVTVRSSYRLTDTRTGELISSGTRAVQAPHDIPAQDFAALRAVRNAEDRAARELAELLRLVVAQELERSTSTSAPVLLSSPEELERRDRSTDPAGI